MRLKRIVYISTGIDGIRGGIDLFIVQRIYENNGLESYPLFSDRGCTTQSDPSL
jgi:hypothetical protein